MTISMPCKVMFTVALISIPAAHAEIIYSGANQNIVIDQSNPTQKISITGSDSNWDDLAIDLKIWDNSKKLNTKATTSPSGNGSHVQTTGIDGMISRYATDSIISAALNYNTKPIDFFSHEISYSYEFVSGYSTGNFQNETGYIGLQLQTDTGTYFGWAQVTVENYNNKDSRLTVHDWAYNSTSDQEIRTGQSSVIPEPTALSMLTACSGGLLFLRRIFLI